MKNKFKSLILVTLLGVIILTLSGCLFKPSEGGIISSGRPYEYFNFTVRNDYTDTNNVELTDGKTGDYSDPGDGPWVGLWKGEEKEMPGTVVIDLGKAQQISSVSAYFWGINVPAKMEVYVSNDAKTWDGPYTYEPGSITGKVGVWYSASVNKVGQYVRCDMFFNGANIWVSEITVIQ
jgi:hypothetical protein